MNRKNGTRLLLTYYGSELCGFVYYFPVDRSVRCTMVRMKMHIRFYSIAVFGTFVWTFRAIGTVYFSPWTMRFVKNIRKCRVGGSDSCVAVVPAANRRVPHPPNRKKPFRLKESNPLNSTDVSRLWRHKSGTRIRCRKKRRQRQQPSKLRTDASYVRESGGAVGPAEEAGRNAPRASRLCRRCDWRTRGADQTRFGPVPGAFRNGRAEPARLDEMDQAHGRMNAVIIDIIITYKLPPAAVKLPSTHDRSPYSVYFDWSTRNTNTEITIISYSSCVYTKNTVIWNGIWFGYIQYFLKFIHFYIKLLKKSFKYMHSMFNLFIILEKLSCIF